jgi:hypothetical protein
VKSCVSKIQINTKKKNAIKPSNLVLGKIMDLDTYKSANKNPTKK